MMFKTASGEILKVSRRPKGGLDLHLWETAYEASERDIAGKLELYETVEEMVDSSIILE
jgi:hypothetical protein